MVESVGKKLSQARLKRNLTIEEAAHQTRLRPDKIIALENDDYSTFASNTYAKGFLQIYGRYLHVDVSEFMQSLESSNAISIEDYQYLSNAPAPRTTEIIKRERRAPSLAPLLFFIFIVGAGLATMWVIENYKRTQPSRHSEKEDLNSQASSMALPAPVTQTPASLNPSEVSPVSRPSTTPSPAPASSPAPVLSAPATSTTSVALAGKPTPASRATLEPRLSPSVLSDRDFVTPTIVPTPDPAAVSSPRSGLNEILIASVKKTWVTIRKDDPKGTPIFEDYLYPNANPLKLKGARFFIDAREPAAVQITKNGLPFAYQAPNVPVQ